jgi:hypothetical protein
LALIRETQTQGPIGTENPKKRMSQQESLNPYVEQAMKKLRRIQPHKVRRNPDQEHPEIDVLIIDTAGGNTPTITARAWKVTHRTNHRTAIRGYQEKGPGKVCPIVHAITKATIPGRAEPVLFGVNYATLIDDQDEHESLIVPFDMMRHGIPMDMTPATLGGTGGMTVDDEFFPFEFDNEKLFWEISKPNKEELDTLEFFELTSPLPAIINNVHRRPKSEIHASPVPMSEWRKRLGMVPEEVVHRTLENTTQYYLSVESETRQDPRRHLKSRLPGLRLPRQREKVASDTFFPSVKSSRGHTCSQFFVGIDTDRWEVYPLKSESQNGTALQDYCRTVGCPPVIRTDNAQSELGKTWTTFCRCQCIGCETTEPHHPWQNPAEKRIGVLGGMVRNAMRTFEVPLGKHDWTQKWCCDVHNLTANKRLNWNCPLTVSLGYTQDISVLRFHIWEPIWYFDPSIKQPNNNLKKGRWLGIAWHAGDSMTYYIETEKDKGRNVILIRSVIRSRRKNIGQENEYINNDPQYAAFFLDPSELEQNAEDNKDEAENLDRGEDLVNPTNDTDPNAPDSGEPEPVGRRTRSSTRIEVETVLEEDDESDQEGDHDPANPSGNNNDDDEDETNEPPLEPEDLENMRSMYDQLQMEDDDRHEFHKIVDHRFDNGVLILNVQYQGEIEETILEIPFSTLKKDVPIELARYIRNKVIDKKRNGYYNLWSTKTLKIHTRVIKRLYRAYNVRATLRTTRQRRVTKNRESRNARNAKIERPEKFGILIPRNTKEALVFDRDNRNTKWTDAIAKEMGSLDRLQVFKYMPSNHKCEKSEGWQYAPMHMIYDIKLQDLRHKARLVAGGHVVDSSNHITYSSTIQDISVRLLMIVAAQNSLDTMVGDIATAFPTAPCAEKVWSRAGPEFGDKRDSIVVLQRALYGLATASRSFHEFFGDCLRQMGFKPTRADQDLWYRKSDDYNGYDYIATHVDDIIIAAKRPAEYMTQIEHEFAVRNKEDTPSYYLGNDVKRVGNRFHISSKKYVTEALRKYQLKYGSVKKENIPMSSNAHPETDVSKLLEGEGITHYQHIVGVCQWLVVAGRFDINYAVSSLSRYSAGPREGHLELARKVFGYLRKYPKRGYIINPEPPNIDASFEEVKVRPDFGGQYSYFREEMDPRFPEALLDELDINLFCDADHAHDKVTGRSITGILGLVGSTPTIWSSKRQASVQTSTFGAEFTALKKAVEDAVMMRYHLRSMGVKVTKATPVYVDNLGVVLNASNPASTLNKKHIALAYHFVREHVANDVIKIRKIHTSDNYADPFTKGLASPAYHGFFYELQCN